MTDKNKQKRGQNDENPDKIAPGMDWSLNREATPEEKKRGDTTKVTRLSLDEVDD